MRGSEEAKPRSRHNENKRLCTGAYFLVGYFTNGHPVLKCRVYRIARTALASPRHIRYVTFTLSAIRLWPSACTTTQPLVRGFAPWRIHLSFLLEFLVLRLSLSHHLSSSASKLSTQSRQRKTLAPSFLLAHTTDIPRVSSVFFQSP